MDDSAKGQIEHQSKLLGPILESMLASVGDSGRTLLKLAALLPPERIPWPWLRELTIRRHPELAADGLPDPWTALRRQVQGLRFLTGSIEDESARMHRLISAHVRNSPLPPGEPGEGLVRAPELDRELRDYLAERADAIDRDEGAPADWELDGFLEAIPHLLAVRPERRLAVDGTFLSGKVMAYRTLAAARSLLLSTGP